MNVKPTKPQKLTQSVPGIRPAKRAGKVGARGRKLVPYAIGFGLIAFIISGLMPKPVPVDTAIISTGPLTVSVLEEGKTRIRHRYIISSPVAGMLNRVDLRAGARIEKESTILATVQPLPSNFLDPRALAEAEARLKATEAAESRSEATLQRARASLDLAEKEKTRSIELKAKGVISNREWDAANNQVDVLSRALKEAEFGVQVARFERAQAEATLQLTSNAGKGEGEPLKILAPISGAVLNVYEESARPVTPGMPVMEIGDPTDIEAEIELLSSDAVGVHPGAPVSIEEWGGDSPLRGRVVLVEPGAYTKVSALGVEEQRVKVRVEFAEPLPKESPFGDRFRVEARIETWHGENILQIPTGALFRRGNDWMTFVVEGSHARLRRVEISHNNGISAQITGGLQQGERIVLHPPDTLTDGARVKISE